MAVTFTVLTGTKATAGSIRYWVNHATVDAEGALIQSQAWIYGRLRAREMRMSTTVALAEDAFYASLPTGFLDPVGLTWRGDSREVDYVHENLLQRYIAQGETTPDSGWPTRYAIWDEKFQFEVKADEDLIGDLTYYGTPADLSASNETNFLTLRFPTLLRHACMGFAYEDRKRQDEAQSSLTLAAALIDEANAIADLGRRGQVLR